MRFSKYEGAEAPTPEDFYRLQQLIRHCWVELANCVSDPAVLFPVLEAIKAVCRDKGIDPDDDE